MVTLFTSEEWQVIMSELERIDVDGQFLFLKERRKEKYCPYSFSQLNWKMDASLSDQADQSQLFQCVSP